MGRAESGAVAALLGLALLVSLCAPLATYVTSLALFGLPHVLVELRYVDERFGGRMRARPFLPWTLGVLALVVGVTALGAAGVRFEGAAALRLAALVPLVAVAVLAVGVARGLGLRLAVALVVTALCALGVLRDPWTGLVIFACLHNLSPLAFLGERLGARGLALGLPVFVLVPALIVLGVPDALLALPAPAAGWRGLAGDSLLAAFVPADLVGRQAWLWFRACVYLQCAHYVFVLWVLPRLGPGELAEPLLGWPRWRTFLPFVGGAGLISALLFAGDFGAARSHYAIPAALHAWIEIPLLVLALRWTSTPGSQPSCSPS